MPTAFWNRCVHPAYRHKRHLSPFPTLAGEGKERSVRWSGCSSAARKCGRQGSSARGKVFLAIYHRVHPSPAQPSPAHLILQPTSPHTPPHPTPPHPTPPTPSLLTPPHPSSPHRDPPSPPSPPLPPPPPRPSRGTAIGLPPRPADAAGSALHAWPADMQSRRDSHRAPPRRPVSLKIGPQIKSNPYPPHPYPPHPTSHPTTLYPTPPHPTTAPLVLPICRGPR